MLKSRNLDDQSFEQIMEFAFARLPWICPVWTDHNAHDPGITILELMAWYKEMQQYHMNVVTDEIRKKLLKLVGARPKAAKPARCLIEPDGLLGATRLRLAKLESAHGIVFELDEQAHIAEAVSGIYTVTDSGASNVTAMLNQPNISVMPFDNGGELLVGVVGAVDRIRLWFEIDSERSVDRNPFDSSDFAPRVVEWSCQGADDIEVTDETHALSESGFVTFASKKGFVGTDAELKLPAAVYIRARLKDAGCEERVRVSNVCANRFLATQRETWAGLTAFVAAADDGQVLLQDELSMHGDMVSFIRAKGGLRVAEHQVQFTPQGSLLTLDTADAAQDGGPNVFVVSLDPLRSGELIFDSTGMPGMTLELPVNGRRVLTDDMALICDTRQPDGSVSPELWRCADDLSCCGPRDRAFVYDPVMETVTFGDGEHGAVVPKGKNAVLAASMALSWCGDGNVPENCGLVFDDGIKAYNTAAFGGKDAQTVNAAAAELLRKLEDTEKCVTESDYERAALTTPGLRVAAAKAIAGFDPEEPTGRSRIPVVTVVAIPYNSGERPVPDERFQKRVRERIEAVRPICTSVKVTAPVYVPIAMTVQVTGDESAKKSVKAAVEKLLRVGRHRAIGDPVQRDDVLECISAAEGVIKVDRLELRPLTAETYVNAVGDISVRKNAVAYLRAADVTVR